jgi:hypothetical protein
MKTQAMARVSQEPIIYGCGKKKIGSFFLVTPPKLLSNDSHLYVTAVTLSSPFRLEPILLLVLRESIRRSTGPLFVLFGLLGLDIAHFDGMERSRDVKVASDGVGETKLSRRADVCDGLEHPMGEETSQGKAEMATSWPSPNCPPRL